MNDKEYRAEKARLRKLADRWVDTLGLGQWEINLEYSRGKLEGENQSFDYTGTETSPAQTHAHWQYMNAMLVFDLTETADYDDEDLERIFVHELSHVLINEMREKGIRHEERVATLLANAFIETRRAGLNEGKRAKPRKKSVRREGKK